MERTQQQSGPRVPLWVWILVAINLLMGVANIVTFTLTRYWNMPSTDMFRLSAEANVPTWWSGSQLLIIGVLLAILAYRLCAQGTPRAWAMWLPPLFFLFLSMDEVAAIHEAVGHRWGTTRLRTGMWVIYGAPLFLLAVWIVTWVVWPFLRGHKRVIRTYAAGLATLFICAVGIELLANLFPDNSLPVHALVLIEEVGEMMGGTLMLWATVQWLSAFRMRITIVPKQDQESTLRNPFREKRGQTAAIA